MNEIIEEVKQDLDNTKTKICNVVINPPKGYDRKIGINNLNWLKDVCLKELDKYPFDYFAIIHDMDKKEVADENGFIDYKTPHMHIVLLSANRHALRYYLNSICTALKLDPFRVSVREAKDRDRSIQYLTHKNNANKYQYDVKSIVSNYTMSQVYEIWSIDTSYQYISATYLEKLWNSCLGDYYLFLCSIPTGLYVSNYVYIRDWIKAYQDNERKNKKYDKERLFKEEAERLLNERV